MKRATVIATLLALAGCRQSRTPEARPAAPFEEAAERTGLLFHHFTGATGEFYLAEIAGSGVALFDYDGDGALDVLLLQGRFLESGKQMSEATYPPPSGWKPGCRLFHNDLKSAGKLHFTDVTEQAGLRFDGYAMGVAVGDYDNNGTLDIYITGFGHTALLRNNGNGTFTDVTGEAGVADDAWSSSAAFVDYDRDGRLDLFVAHYVEGTKGLRKRCRTPLGDLDYCGPSVFRPAVARLYHNEGGGKFRNVTAASGIGAAAGPGLGVLCADFNHDGWMDIYVANDGAASYLWLNQRNGTFREAALESGVAYNADGKAQAGMGVAAGDFDNDGDEDLFKSNQIREGANLYHNDGAGLFTDIGPQVGLANLTFGLTGFGAGWVDYDHDGWLDLFLANGAVAIMEDQRGKPYPYRQTNLLLHNEGGKRLKPATPDGGVSAVAEVSRGVAFGDIDNDGDVDIVVSNNNGPARLYLNNTSKADSAQAHWLHIRLQGTRSDRFGLHALVTVERPSGGKLARRLRSSGSYLSASDPSVHFGLGPDRSVRSIRVQWPDGSAESWGGTPADRIVTLKQGSGR